MKVIDLLNKIANKEKLPERIKFNSEIYLSNEVGAFLTEDGRKNFIGNLYFIEELNDEIEIIEEYNPIEKIFGLHHPSTKKLDLIREDIGLAFKTIDKLIDKLNELEKENE